MDELIKFLNDRLEEEYEVIRKATPGSWKEWGMQVMADQDGTSNVETAVPVANVTYVTEDGPQLRTFNSRFMCLFDPVRMLEEIKMKLQMIGYAQMKKDRGFTINTVMDIVSQDYLEMLAWPYRNHKDFKAEWVPNV